MKFRVFGTSKHGEEKSISNVFFATLISTLWRFYPRHVDRRDVAVLGKGNSSDHSSFIFSASTFISVAGNTPRVSIEVQGKSTSVLSQILNEFIEFVFIYRTCHIFSRRFTILIE